MRTLAVLFLGLVAMSFPAGPAAGKDKEKLVVTPGEKKDGLEILNCSPKGRALLYVPEGLDPAKKPGLLVALHGHGGQPDGYVSRDFADRRKWIVVAVEGRTDVQGAGKSWETDPGGDPPYVNAVAKWVVQNKGVDPTQVVLFGHSMGGTMSLACYAGEPSLYAGIVTCASPYVPDKRQETTRCAVWYGTKDGNFGNAKQVQNMLKKDAGRLSLWIADEAEHNDTPDAPYLDLAVSWVLQKNAIGHEIHVPKAPPAEPAAGLRHVLFRHKGAADAPADVKRSKDAAKSAADDLLKRLRAGKANFAHEAQALSDDVESRPIGGAVAPEKLAAFGGAAATAKDAPKGADRWSGPFESPAGWHVVERAP
jgi:pimeloyl-ACP methyl ester carboxylesterase